MSKSIFGIIIAMFAFLFVKAEQPTFNISSADAGPGEIIDINFQVDDFADIISVQYSVNWNPDILSFRTIKNFSPNVPGLSPSVFGTPQVLIDQGKFTLSWIESSITPITIADGSLFFTVEFEVIGDPCQSTAVAITNNPLEIEVAEVGEVLVGLIVNNGFVNIPGSGCSEDIQVIGNSVIGACGGNTCIQFTVENFTTVGAMEFSLVYDPAILEFDEFQNFAPLPGFGEGNTNLLSPGTLRVLWINSNVENDTLPDGTVLFEICFDVIGTGGQSSEITFGNNPPVSFLDIDGNEHVVDITPAMITAQCALEGFALIADTVCTMPNGDACFNIQVNDFDEIIALQFSLNWDPDVFEFDRVEGFGIPGLDLSGFGTPGFPGVIEGETVVSWLDLSLEGVTLPDYTTIFTICLQAVGNAGTSSPLTFSAEPLEIEFANIDSTITDYTLVHGRGEIKTSCSCDQLSYTLTPTHPTCPGQCNGSLNLSVNENCPEIPTYMWSNGFTTEDLFELCAGSYTVTITLGSQIVIATATLTDPLPVAVTSTVTNPNPPGSSNGSVDITVTGGMAPYTYMWSPGGSTNQDLINVPSGIYTVTVTDSKGCTFVPDPYVVGAELVGAIQDVSCFGGSNGAINLTVSFGTGPHTFSWNTNPVQTSEDISNLSAGSYCVTVTDAGGSARDSCFTVSQPAVLVVSATVSNDENEDCQGAIDLNVTGGAMPYTYLWSNGPITQDLTQLCGGQYCVSISYGQGCSLDTCFVVSSGNISINLVATQYGEFQVSCSGECDGEIMSVVTGGSNTYTYSWSNGATTAHLSGLCAGTYTLTVTDDTGNMAISSVTLNEATPFSLAYITTNPSDYITTDGAITVIVNGGTPDYTYQWTGPVSGSTASLNNVPAGTYTILITDENGCEIMDSEQLLPEVDVDCYSAMKVFTPNSDGKNDVFIITCVLDFENHLYIFNRYGGLVYETEDYQNDWIGVDQDGQPVPDGGYPWVLEITRQDGSTELIKGTLSLVRTAD